LNHWASAFKQVFLHNRLIVALVILSYLLLPLKVNFASANAQKALQESYLNREVIAVIEQYREETDWIFTDTPIYAFYTRLKVIPELAVVSQKRWRSGNLNPDNLQAWLQEYQPEQIILGRFEEMIEIVETDFTDQYKLVFKNEESSCYLKRQNHT
jgi:hypothetical protein